MIEKVRGTELEKRWEDMTGRQRYEIVKPIAWF
jgi:hypothetical protein